MMPKAGEQMLELDDLDKTIIAAMQDDFPLAQMAGVI